MAEERSFVEERTAAVGERRQAQERIGAVGERSWAEEENRPAVGEHKRQLGRKMVEERRRVSVGRPK